MYNKGNDQGSNNPQSQERTQAALLDFHSSTFVADPFPAYRRLREEDPLHWNTSTSDGDWYLTRYNDIVAALRDERFGREIRRVVPQEQLPEIPKAYEPLAHMCRSWFSFRDPPDHTRLRSLVNRAFSPRVVEAMRPRIEEIAEDLLTAVQGSSSMDLIADFAFPLPVIVIAEMLGLPLADRAKFKQWSSALNTALVNPGAATPDVLTKATEATLQCSEYLGSLIKKRRRDPQNDLLSALIATHEQTDKLTEEELVSVCMLLLNAGHESSLNFIGNSMLTLLQHPHQLQQLRGEPDLMPRALEELLRYESPFQMTFRVAFTHCTLHGKTIEPGQSIGMVLAAANRDPIHFPNPDRLEFTRLPARHLAFGLGRHSCIGAPLARAEGQIAITTLLRRFSKLELLQDVPQWNGNLVFRGLTTLPIAFS